MRGRGVRAAPQVAGRAVTGFVSERRVRTVARSVLALHAKIGELMWSGSRLLLGFIFAVILTYVFVGGPPYPGIDGFTPYGPIAIALLATSGSAVLVHRLTHNTTLGVSTGLLIMALALIALAQIATAAYIPAGLLVVLALSGFIAAWRGGRGQRRPRAA